MEPIQITLKAARVNMGLTIKQAAKRFDINHERLAQYEKDSTNVPRSFFINIENVYGVPVDNIFFGKQEDYISGITKRDFTFKHV